MSEDIASLGIKVDASTADAAAGKLDNLTKSGAQAETQLTKTAKATDVYTKSTTQAASATGVLAASQSDAAKASDALVKRATDLINTYDPAARAQTAYNSALKEAKSLLDANAISQREYGSVAAAAQQVLSDAVSKAAHDVSTNSKAISESLVLAREAARGNFTRMAGSATVLTSALGLSVVSVLGYVAAAALIAGPFIIAGLAIDKYNDKQREFTDLSNGVGASIGLTAKQIDAAATSGAASQNISIGLAQEFAEVYAKTGKIGGDVLTTLTENTLKFANATGETAADASKELATAFSDPAKGAKTLNDQLSFLNATQLEHITQLSNEGNLTQAQAELATALTERIKDQSTEVGVLKKAWADASKSVTDYFDGLGKRLSQGDVGEQLASAQKALKDFSATGVTGTGAVLTGADNTQYYAMLSKAVADLTDKFNMNTAAAKANTAASAANAASAKAGALTTQLLPSTQTIPTLTAQKAVLGAGLASGAGDSAATLANMQKAYDGVSDALTRTTDAYAKYGGAEGVTNQIDKLKIDSVGNITKAQKGQDDQQIFMLQHMGDLVTTTQLTTEATNAGALVADKYSKAGQGQVTSAEKLLLSTEDQLKSQTALNTAVLSGSITVAQQSEATKIDTQLKGLNANAELASGAAKQKQIAIINALRPLLASLYTANETAVLLKQNEATGDANKLLQVQIANVGKSNLQQAQALAIAKEQQRLNTMGSVSPEAAKQALQLTSDQAALNVQLTTTQTAYNQSLTATSDLYAELDTQAQDAASHITTAFGTVGKSLGDLTTSITGYYAKQSKLSDDYNAKVKAGTATQQDADAYTLKSRDLQISSDGAILESTASFFSAKSAIYKVLMTVDAAYRAAQLITAIGSIANDAATTASSVASSETKATASGIAAIAKTFEEWGWPWGVVAAAAVTGALVAAGVSMFGGSGGGGAAPVDTSAKDNQAAQGTGSVLGDSTAQSASIANSIDALQKDQNTSLSYFSQMVVSLKYIQTNIGTLTASLSNALTASNGGNFDTSNLGIGSSGDSTTTLTDQGVYLKPQTVGQTIQDAHGGYYNNTQQVTTDSGFLGIGGGTTTTNGYVDHAFGSSSQGSALSSEISSVIGGLATTVENEAGALGIKGAQAIVDSLNLNIGKISLKGLTGDQINTALNAVFSKVGDQMAASISPIVNKLQLAGEGQLETLSRLVNEYQVSQQVFETVGISYDVLGVKSLAARDRVVQLSGGLDNFTSQAQAYVQEFLTTAQQIAPIAKAVTTEMDSLGLGFVKTKAQFEAVVSGLNVSTAAGAKLYAELMAVAPAFGQVADAAATLQASARGQEETVLGDEGKSLQLLNMQRVDELTAMDASLRPMQTLIYALQDQATATTALTTANQNLKTAQTNLLQLELTKDNTALTNAQKNVTTATTDLTNAYNTQASTLTTTVSTLKNYATTLAQFKQSLTTGQSNGNIIQDYATDKATFDKTAAGAAKGNQTDLGNFATVAQNFLTASAAASPTAGAYAADLAAVNAATTAAQKAATKGADTAQLQLDALNKQVAGLINVNKSVGTVATEVTKLQTALAAQAAAQKTVNETQYALDKANGTASLKSASAALVAAQAAQAQAKAALLAAQAVVHTQEVASAAATQAQKVAADKAVHQAAYQGIDSASAAASKASGGATAVNLTVVNDLFKYLLGRAGTSDELAFIGGMGDKVSDIAQAIKASAEYKATSAQWKLSHYAQGAIFTNGVVSQPTNFNIGQMGEKGPEAIVPLVRGPQGLGVRALGGGSNDNGQLLAELRAIRQLLESVDKDSAAGIKLTKEMRDLFRAVTQGSNTVITSAA